MSCGLTIESEYINVYKWNQEKGTNGNEFLLIINIMPQMLLTKLVLNPEYSLKLCMTQFLCRSSASRMDWGIVLIFMLN